MGGPNCQTAVLPFMGKCPYHIRQGLYILFAIPLPDGPAFHIAPVFNLDLPGARGGNLCSGRGPGLMAVVDEQHPVRFDDPVEFL